MEDFDYLDIFPNQTNDLAYERKFWNQHLLQKIIFIPLICHLCGNYNVSLTEYKTLANPYIGRCTSNKCRKIFFLKTKTFLDFFPKQSDSIVLYVLKLSIIEKKNCIEIYNKFKDDYPNISITKDMIYKILKYMRIYIANYFKDLYKIENISTENAYNYYAIDDSDLVKINGNILWVIGIINTSTKYIGLEVSFNRDQSIMKKIISGHIKKGNYIVTD